MVPALLYLLFRKIIRNHWSKRILFLLFSANTAGVQTGNPGNVVKNICQMKCIGIFLFMISILLFLSTLIISNGSIYYTTLFFIGWFSWTFTEYIIHRFWMHKTGRTESHDHHHHHTHPTDIKITTFHRFMMMGAVVGVGVLALFINMYLLIVDGFLFGFAAYSCMHWVLHQSWSRKLFPRLHRYHIYHHCKFPNSCYGITLTWWDMAFGTHPPGEAKITGRILAFYYGHEQGKSSTHKINLTTLAHCFI